MARQRSKSIRFGTLALIGALLITLVAAPACGGQMTPEFSGSPAAGEHAVGQPVQIGSYIITVNQVLDSAGPDAATPTAGKRFVVLRLTLQNTSGDVDRVAPYSQMHLRDAYGNEYQTDDSIVANSKADLPALPDTIPPLGQVGGIVGFAVPSDAEGLKLVFNPSFLSSLFNRGKTAVIDLQ